MSRALEAKRLYYILNLIIVINKQNFGLGYKVVVGLVFNLPSPMYLTSGEGCHF